MITLTKTRTPFRDKDVLCKALTVVGCKHAVRGDTAVKRFVRNVLARVGYGSDDYGDTIVTERKHIYYFGKQRFVWESGGYAYEHEVVLEPHYAGNDPMLAEEQRAQVGYEKDRVDELLARLRGEYDAIYSQQHEARKKGGQVRAERPRADEYCRLAERSVNTPRIAWSEAWGPSPLEMVFVPDATFMMGVPEERGADCEDDEKPAHKVMLDEYYIGKYPVTQMLWNIVMEGTPLADPSRFKGDDLPVENVSWNDIVSEFLPRLNAMTGRAYRLPTEAEWEYAARGGAKSGGYKYAGNNDINEVAWYLGNSGKKTHPVGKKAPNELEIYDMSGNVWESVSDRYGCWYSTDYARLNPTGSASGRERVGRGGSWGDGAGDCRLSNRYSFSPVNRYAILGFRLALSP